MIDTRHSAHESSANATAVGRLSAFLGRRMSGVLGSGNGRCRRLAVTMTVFATALLIVPVALAAPRPILTAGNDAISNVTADSAHVAGGVVANGLETEYRLEYSSEPQNAGSWQSVPGGTGTVSAVQASEGTYHHIAANLTGLTPATVYAIRLFVKNTEGVATSASQAFSTTGPPGANTFAGHALALGSETLRVLGGVTPNAGPTDEEQTLTIGGGATGGTLKLCFEGQCTGASATGATVAGSSIVTLPLAPVKGTGDVEQASGNGIRITHVVATLGRFLPEHSISGPGIPPSAVIESIKEGGAEGTVLLIKTGLGTGGFTEKVLGAELISTGPLPPFARYESISGVGIPPGTTITGLSLEKGDLVLSAPATETNAAVAVSADVAFIPHETEPGEVSEQDRLLQALALLPTIGRSNGEGAQSGGGPANVKVSENFATNTYTIEFTGPLGGRDLPEITVDGSGLTPSGTVTVTTVQNGAPFSYGYHFEYTTTDFADCGTPANPACFTTPEVELGESANGAPMTVGADLPEARPGQSYSYRIVATNSTPGHPQVPGAARSLRVPAGGAVAGLGPCANEGLRAGPSAQLPDCRAYEQVTPVDKHGAQDTYTYTGSLSTTALVGEDGEHVMVEPQFSKWDLNADPKSSSYFFAREGSGWRMTSTTPPPAIARQNSYKLNVVSPGLTRAGVGVRYGENVGTLSPNMELMAGPPGGPYALAATVPSSLEAEWVAAAPDFSKLILATTDRALVPGHHSKTTAGRDLYEYAEGELHQVNVTTAGGPLSTCGATMAQPNKGGAPGAAISSDGSRVLFKDNCTHHLYMRIDGAETVDLGEYSLFAANAGDTQLLVKSGSGNTEQVYLIDTEANTTQLLPNAREGSVSEDLSTIYFSSAQQLTPDAPAPSQSIETGTNNGTAPDLYRYDVPAHIVSFTGIQISSPTGVEVSSDGRYFTFVALAVLGLYGPHNGVGEPQNQAYRYDSSEDVVQCLSCSSFNPRPKRPVTVLGGLTGESEHATPNLVPRQIAASANGDYVFFDTAAALLPSDVDGEVEPCNLSPSECGEQGTTGEELGNHNNNYSVSSDVYEWRRYGLDGCAQVQGCLTLITSGTGGLQNVLLGTDASGRDVFFATHSQLAPTDTDNQGDVYDARIGGGFPPPPPRPVECEGDACSTPAVAPSDLTPASASFQGADNLLAPPAPVVAPPARLKTRVRPCTHGTKGKKHCRTSKRRGRKATHAPPHAATTSRPAR